MTGAAADVPLALNPRCLAVLNRLGHAHQCSRLSRILFINRSSRHRTFLGVKELPGIALANGGC